MSDINVQIDIRIVCIINMRDSFYGNNPRSNKDRATPTVRPVNRSDELKVLQDIISNPRKSQNVKKDSWLAKQAVIVLCVVI
jgi:hypothetical protein